MDEYERLADQLEFLEDSLTIVEGRLRDTPDAVAEWSCPVSVDT